LVEGEGETVATELGGVVWLTKELEAGLRDGQEACSSEGYILDSAVEQSWHQ